MPALTLYALTALVFLILDALMLSFVMKPLFTRHIGPLMADPIRMAGWCLGFALLARGETLTFAALELVGQAFLALMAWNLIPRWGVEGATFSTLLESLFSLLMLILVLARTGRAPTGSSLAAVSGGPA